MSKLVEIFANRCPSYQTIKNWITQIKEPKIKETKTNFSGYYSFDEQYIKENGQWIYRLALFDIINNVVVAEELSNDIHPKTISKFIDKNTYNKKLVYIITDLKRVYQKIIDKIGFKH